ncbi:hypothetical protein BN136_2000 [Cronobacter universalis NCTC 9529]|nr:hypothetical protein BN136_2000 [Cronobacter universalis NCTC 9529]
MKINHQITVMNITGGHVGRRKKKITGLRRRAQKAAENKRRL